MSVAIALLIVLVWVTLTWIGGLISTIVEALVEKKLINPAKKES